jgi:hypothetical protein
LNQAKSKDLSATDAKIKTASQKISIPNQTDAATKKQEGIKHNAQQTPATPKPATPKPAAPKIPDKNLGTDVEPIEPSISDDEFDIKRKTRIQ